MSRCEGDASKKSIRDAEVAGPGVAAIGLLMATGHPTSWLVFGCIKSRARGGPIRGRTFAGQDGKVEDKLPRWTGVLRRSAGVCRGKCRIDDGGAQAANHKADNCLPAPPMTRFPGFRLSGPAPKNLACTTHHRSERRPSATPPKQKTVGIILTTIFSASSITPQLAHPSITHHSK